MKKHLNEPRLLFSFLYSAFCLQKEFHRAIADVKLSKLIEIHHVLLHVRFVAVGGV
jgi:hypothetical protein